MGRNLQVLVVDPDIEHRARLKQSLATLAYAVVGEANYGIEATRLATELQPDIILVHIEQPLALAFRTLEVVQLARPSATPVAVSAMTDIETLRKAMLFGARGFLVSPPAEKELDEVLRKAYEHQQRLLNPERFDEAPAIAGTVMTVFGPKGGVGKTTLSTNLAIEIREQTEARVVLVDLDAYFGDVAIMMGIEPDSTFSDLITAMRRGDNASPKDFIVRHRSGVDIIAAPHSMDAGPQPTPEEIAATLKQLAESYDFVVVDTPGAFSPLVAAALDESSLVLMVTSADMASIKDSRLSLDVLRGAGFDDDRLKLVVNHATNANSVTEADVARTVGCGIFWSIPHDRAVPISTQHGVPLVVSNPRAQMAQRVEALASYLCRGETGQEAISVAARGFGFGSLLRRSR